MSLAASCIPSTFSPTVFGAEILSIQASVVSNYSEYVPSTYRYTQPSIDVEGANFCNVTVTYTHPGQDDMINVEAWLPLDNWNSRFQAVGGGGWVAGRFFLSYYAMVGAIGDGYATITTDAGLASSPEEWALLSDGNVNLYAMQNFGATSLGDEAIIGKSLIRSFYGRDPSYSYWNGCSQGGRQGLALAQRYPGAYDGIAAGAPAVYTTWIAPSIFWPQEYMNLIQQYPFGCELDAITTAAYSFCDGLDGVTDGLISNVEACIERFDPFSVVGTSIKNCTQTGGEVKVSSAAAAVANATWRGWTTVEGKQGWFGLNIGADLTGDLYSYNTGGVAVTNCSGGVCVGEPSSLATDWLTYFLAKNPDFDYTNISHKTFDTMSHMGHQQFQSFLDTNDPDLNDFREAGGKLVTFHGLADNLIPTKGTEHYYNKVSQVVPDVDSFYRHFNVPGLGHCFGGKGGAQPSGLFEQLRAWVENRTTFETTSITLTTSNGTSETRILCPYPQTAYYDSGCGSSANTGCWSCIDA